MATDDPLDSEISLSGELTASGIKGKVKSRAVSAFDRLVGNIIDWPSAMLEKKNNLERAEGKMAVAITDAKRDVAVDAIKSAADEISARARADFEEQLVRRRLNKEAVVIEAINDLKMLPPPQGEADDVSGAASLDEDWLNYFESFSEKASSENMRKLWGRILSGEIRKPGAFSLSTLRIVSELSTNTARIFEKYARQRIGYYSIYSSDILFQEVGEALDLVSIGLLHEVDASYGQLIKFSNPGAFVERLDDNYFIGVKFFDEELAEFNLPSIPMTKYGRELAELIPINKDEVIKSYLEAFDGIMTRADLLTGRKIGDSNQWEFDVVENLHTYSADEEKEGVEALQESGEASAGDKKTEAREVSPKSPG